MQLLWLTIGCNISFFLFLVVPPWLRFWTSPCHRISTSQEHIWEFSPVPSIVVPPLDFPPPTGWVYCPFKGFHHQHAKMVLLWSVPSFHTHHHHHRLMVSLPLGQKKVLSFEVWVRYHLLKDAVLQPQNPTFQSQIDRSPMSHHSEPQFPVFRLTP